MTAWSNFQFKVRWTLGYVPFLRRYIFMDAESIFRKLVDDGVVEYIRDLRATERRLLHFSLGMQIRNAFLLWHPKNPHTSLALEGLSDENQAASPRHPDNFSWAILSRLIVKATDGEANEISRLFDAQETLTYSLLARSDDSEETLYGIREAMLELVAKEQYAFMELVFGEALLLAASPAKIEVLLESVKDIRVSGLNYDRLRERAKIYGVGA